MKETYLVIVCNFDEELEFGAQGVAFMMAFSTEKEAIAYVAAENENYGTDHWQGGIYKLDPTKTTTNHAGLTSLLVEELH